MTLIRRAILLERTLRPHACTSRVVSSFGSTGTTTSGHPFIAPTAGGVSFQRLPTSRRPFSSGQVSGSDHHAFFQQQLEELNAERTFLLGSSADDDDDSKSLVDEGNRLKELQQHQQQQHSAEFLRKQGDERTATSLVATTGGDDFEADLEDLHAERQALFQFTSQEMNAWQSHSGHSIQSSTLPAELFKEIEQARASADHGGVIQSSFMDQQERNTTVPSYSGSVPSHQEHHGSFSHVSRDGQSIHMVDVGQKEVTTRVATAQTQVILPPDVLEAFHFQKEGGDTAEMVGPKGPIFATAKLAGIMAAK
jgi:MoaC family